MNEVQISTLCNVEARYKKEARREGGSQELKAK